MARSYREVMINKSDDGLMDYLTNFNKYTPDAIRAAVDELKRRGKNFSDEELKEISLKIETRKNANTDEDELFAPTSWKKEVVTDTNAPLLYSKGAIRGFSILFSVVFGAILLSYNINDTKKKWIVIGFGLIYTALTAFIVNLIPSKIFWAYLLSTAGGLGLTTTFWDMFIGKEIKYRAKPIWIPLIISVIITIPIVLAVIYS